MEKRKNSRRFQVLALSGGGFRGLYTAKILADLEKEIGAPIATRFDLIAGTSIGGILALAIAMEIPAQQIVDLFVNHGKNIFKRRLTLGILKSSYSGKYLYDILSDDRLFGNQALEACKHPVIVPAINYSSGNPQIFKTPHHIDFKRDYTHKLVDIALATSAAPAYFPRHTFNNNQYVDGGLYANAPGMLAVHEANTFFECSNKKVHLLSIGTMSSKFTVNPAHNRSGGTYDWGGLNPANMPKRLFGLTISVQESLVNSMLQHQLADRYVHLDDNLTDERAKAVDLDKVDDAAQEALLGAASIRSQAFIGDSYKYSSYMEYIASPAIFYYGKNKTTKVNHDQTE